MDKSVNPFVYEPPRAARTDASQRSILAKEASHSRAVQSQSFEAALDQIRQRENPDSIRDASASHAAVSAEEAADNLDTNNTQAEPQRLLQPPGLQTQGMQSEQMSIEEQNSAVLMENANAVSGLHDSQSLSVELRPDDKHAVSANPGNETVSTGVGAVEPGSSAAPSSTTATENNTLHGRLTAERVSSLMLQMENAVAESSGQWRFGVIDDPAGVTGLQLQQNERGEWRVSVSFDESTPVDTKAQAEELKQSLLDQGHSVDSVTVMRASHRFTLNDD